MAIAPIKCLKRFMTVVEAFLWPSLLRRVARVQMFFCLFGELISEIISSFCCSYFFFIFVYIFCEFFFSEH